jgi:hypothetical protein
LKRGTAIFALFLALIVSSQTLEPGLVITDQSSPQSPVENLGKIIMFRPSSITGAGFACPIRYRGHELVELGRGKWAEWSVKPGRYTKLR